MICYKCHNETGKGNTCQVCGADVAVFQRVRRLSNMYYNDGLQKAEVRNLSGAIISLKKSLKFNKYNIDARNLLGLVYYEMGETVDALSEWVISQSYQAKDNLANRYLDEIRQNRGQLEANNQTIKKYNQALLYCKQDSRDLAIIQLKKVLSINPKLVKGHQLLALLYIQEGKLEQAKKTLRNAGKIDANNTITLRYLKEVNAQMKEQNTGKKKKDDDLISYQSGNETIIMPKRFQELSLGMTLLYLVVGLVVGASIIGFLVVPEIQKQAKENLHQSQEASKDIILDREEQIEALQAEIGKLQKDLQDALEQKEVTPAQLDAYEKLLSAYVSYIGQDVMATGNTIIQIDPSQLSESARSIYDTIWTAVSETYYRTLYNAGYESHQAENYADAIAKLEIVVKSNIDYEQGNAAYYLAQSYRKSGNLTAALPYYQHIVTNYPDTEMARTAERYINGES